jgi:predicted ester cyclase
VTSDELISFAQRYAKAWCSQNPKSVAAFFAENGSLSVNDGPPAVGRAAIVEVAQGFMRTFPDMVVTMDDVSRDSDGTKFHWTLTGTNTGPGGTGKCVRVSGYELWKIDNDGLIAESEGHFDRAEYERQLKNLKPAVGRFRVSRVSRALVNASSRSRTFWSTENLRHPPI